eukprot:4708254-Pyramimonas_sp.AAC.1
MRDQCGGVTEPAQHSKQYNRLGLLLTFLTSDMAVFQDKIVKIDVKRAVAGDVVIAMRHVEQEVPGKSVGSSTPVSLDVPHDTSRTPTSVGFSCSLRYRHLAGSSRSVRAKRLEMRARRSIKDSLFHLIPRLVRES